MNTPEIELEIDQHIARLWLNRTERHNALSPEMMSALAKQLARLGHDPAVRVIVLAGRGKSFCAGADLGWMLDGQQHDADTNRSEAARLAHLLRTLYRCPKPTVARVHGTVLGGGVGLLACCDIVLASDDAQFGLPEVRFGLIPATIGPYVVAAIGQRATRRYALTGERFSAMRASRLGLVHEVYPPSELDSHLNELLHALLQGGPKALERTKAMLAKLGPQSPLEDAVLANSIDLLARLRCESETREGLAAFFEHRPARWCPPAEQ